MLSLLQKFALTSWAAVAHLNFRAGSTFPVPVCTVPSSMDRTGRCNKVDAVRLYGSYRFNLLLLKGQWSVTCLVFRPKNCKCRHNNIMGFEIRYYNANSKTISNSSLNSHVFGTPFIMLKGHGQNQFQPCYLVNRTLNDEVKTEKKNI